MKFIFLLLVSLGVAFSQYHEFEYVRTSINIELKQKRGDVQAIIETKTALRVADDYHQDYINIIIDSPYYASVSELECNIGREEVDDFRIEQSFYERLDIFFSDYKYYHIQIPTADAQKKTINYSYVQTVNDISMLPPIAISGSKGENNLKINVEAFQGLEVNFLLDSFDRELSPIIMQEKNKYSLELARVKGIKPSPYAYPFSSPGRVLLQLTGEEELIPLNPVAISKWYYHSKKAKLQKSSPPDLEIKMFKAFSSENKISILDSLYDFVCNDIRYLGDVRKKHLFLPNAPGTVMHNRYGDCKDKATLLVALADSFGIELYPTLVKAGATYKPKHYSLYNYNHMICAYQKSAGNWLFLDPTATAFSFGALPGGLIGREALILKPDSAITMAIPHQTKSQLNVTLKLDPDQPDSTSAFFIATGEYFARFSYLNQKLNKNDLYNSYSASINPHFYRQEYFDFSLPIIAKNELVFQSMVDLNKLIITGSKGQYMPLLFFNLSAKKLKSDIARLPFVFWGPDLNLQLSIELPENYHFAWDKDVKVDFGELSYNVTLDAENDRVLKANLRLPQKAYAKEEAINIVSFIKKTNMQKKNLVAIKRSAK
jgi:hypothetical protein